MNDPVVVAAFQSGAVTHALILGILGLLARIARRALDPATLREFTRRRAVRAVLKAGGSRLSDVELDTVRVLLGEDSAAPEADTPSTCAKPIRGTPRWWRRWRRQPRSAG